MKKPTRYAAFAASAAAAAALQWAIRLPPRPAEAVRPAPAVPSTMAYNPHAAATPPPSAATAGFDSNAAQATVATATPVDSIGQALTGYWTPNRPLAAVLKDFRGTHAPGDALQIEVLAALSFCDAAGDAAEYARIERSEGGSRAIVDGLEARHRAWIRMCQPMNAGDLRIRSELLLARARAGDVDAMLNYYVVGPSGSWRQEWLNPSDADAATQWHARAADLLAEAARRGKAAALDVLSAAYERPLVDAGHESAVDPWAHVRDDVRAYAYGLAFAEHLRAHNDMAHASYRAGTLRRLAERLSLEDQARAGSLSEEIRQALPRAR